LMRHTPPPPMLPSVPVSPNTPPFLCRRGALPRWTAAALLAAGVCGPPWPVTAVAQQSPPMTLSGPGGETIVVADRIQQIGGDSDLFLATGNVEITRGNNRLVADR